MSLAGEAGVALQRARSALVDMRPHLAMVRLAQSVELRYRPDQPRAPKGTRTGGQWVSGLAHTVDRLERLHAAEVDVERIAWDLVTLGGGEDNNQHPRGHGSSFSPTAWYCGSICRRGSIFEDRRRTSI